LKFIILLLLLLLFMLRSMLLLRARGARCLRSRRRRT